MGSLAAFDVAKFADEFALSRFVETGTGRGDSLAYAATVTRFTSLLSCEIEPLLAVGAIARFGGDPRVSICRMSSPAFIRMTAADDMPTLYWLDAHYSGVGFGFAHGVYSLDRSEEVMKPLAAEVDALKGSRTSVIVIDDLRIYESGEYANGPLPSELGVAQPHGGDWIRDAFALTHSAHTLLQDEGYLLLLPQ